MNQALSRRGFLHMVGAFGGSAAMYQAALGMNLLPAVAHAERPDIAPIGGTLPCSATAKSSACN